MNYCPECGAYIPDGDTKCVSCGFDTAQKKSKKESGGAQGYTYNYGGGAAAQAEAPKENKTYEYSYNYEAEDDAAKRAEQEKKKADQEAVKQAVKEAARQAKEATRRARDEMRKARRDAQKQNMDSASGYYYQTKDTGPYESQEKSYDARDTGPYEAQDDGGFKSRDYTSDAALNKGMAILSYIGPLCFIPYFSGSKSPFVKFHAGQGVSLFTAEVLVSLCNIIPVVGQIAAAIGGVGILLAFISGIGNASSGKMKKIPFFGDFNIFK